MKQLITMCVVGMLVAAGGGIRAQGNAQGEKLLEGARRTEVVEGDLRGAIAQYMRIVNQFKAQPEIAARALYQLAQCQEKLGQAEAKKSYERILREYGAAAEYASAARTRLAAMDVAVKSDGGTMKRLVWAGAGVDDTGTVSGDGRYLSFTDWETGDLAIRDFTSKTNLRLTNTGGWRSSGDYAENSVISPDGRQVAYSWGVAKTRLYELRVLPIAGGVQAKPRIVHAAVHWIQPFAWTADGDIVINREPVDGRSEIVLVSSANGNARVLKVLDGPVGPRSISLSPDGRYLAYDCPLVMGQQRDIFLLPMDGAAATPLVHGSSSDRHPVWSPDGSRLLFISDRTGSDRLWSVRFEKGQTQGRAEQVTAETSARPLGITRTGALYYSKGETVRNVMVTELDRQMKATGTSAPLTERFLNSNGTAAWSPDGEKVAFYSLRGPRDTPGSTVIVVHTLKTGTERDLSVNLSLLSNEWTPIKWFPDGRSVLVIARNAEQRVLEYHRVDVTTGATQLVRATKSLGPARHQVDVSPDGRFLYHMDADAGKADRLVRFELETGRETALKTTWAGSLAVSPDGSQVAYVGSSSGEGLSSSTSQIVVMPSAGGEGRVLVDLPWTDFSRFNTLGWSRDSRFLLFAKQEGGAGPQHLWRVPTSGGQPEKIGISVNGQIKSPQMHPDGKRILYATSQGGIAEVWVLENFLPARKKGT